MIKTFYRAATLPKAEAIKTLLERYPSADVLKFVEKKASKEEAEAANVSPGSKIYEAQIRIHGDALNPDQDPDLAEPLPKKNPKGLKDLKDPKDLDSDPDPDPAFDLDTEDEPKAMSNDEKIVHLLEQILDALKSKDDEDEDEDEDEEADKGEEEKPDLLAPDIGVPEEGDELAPDPSETTPGVTAPRGPKSPASTPGAPAGRRPVPPPVKPRTPGAPAAFAKFDPRLAKVTLVREGVSKQVKTKELLAEAEELFGKTHKVARIRRNGVVDINGTKVDLPANELAVVTLVRRN